MILGNTQHRVLVELIRAPDGLTVAGLGHALGIDPRHARKTAEALAKAIDKPGAVAGTNRPALVDRLDNDGAARYVINDAGRDAALNPGGTPS